MLLIAIAAINWPCPIGLEGDLCRLSALRAGYVRHLSWAAVEVSATASVTAAATILSLEHFISLSFSIDSKNRTALQKTSQQTQLNRRNAAFF
jgi:hypothetical protein